MGNITFEMSCSYHTLTVFTCEGLVTSTAFDIDIPNAPDALCHEAEKQFSEYFSRKRTSFELPYDIDPLGTPFFRSILHAIEKIPYGKVISYKDAAFSAGSFAVRAAGSALKKNPLPIIIPCHRIICADRTLGHYMGGRGDDIKKYLLSIEGVAFDNDTGKVVG